MKQRLRSIEIPEAAHAAGPLPGDQLGRDGDPDE